MCLSGVGQVVVAGRHDDVRIGHAEGCRQVNCVVAPKSVRASEITGDSGQRHRQLDLIDLVGKRCLVGRPS